MFQDTGGTDLDDAGRGEVELEGYGYGWLRLMARDQ